MRTRSLAITSTMLMAMGLCASRARAQDRCEVFDGAAQTGTAKTMTLPTVTTSSVSGATWGTTTTRLHSTDLGALDNKTSSARIRAVDSDVALYFLDGGDFNGSGQAFHCKKGRSCTLELGSMNDKTSSAICQREFARKANVTDPNAHPLVVLGAGLDNPTIDLKTLSDAVDLRVEDLIGNDPSLSGLRHVNSEDGESLWSRTTWITEWQWCKSVRDACTPTSSMKFRDMFQISKRFEVEITGEPFFADDDYVIQLDWFVRPVIKDHDGDPATPVELRFHWGSTSWWVEAGLAHDSVLAEVEPKVRAVNVQEELRAGLLLTAFSAGLPANMFDGKDRLQFAIFSANNLGKATWQETFNMGTTHAKVVLNRTRDAIYP